MKKDPRRGLLPSRPSRPLPTCREATECYKSMVLIKPFIKMYIKVFTRLLLFFSFQVTERPPLTTGPPTNAVTPKLFCPYSSTGKIKSHLIFYVKFARAYVVKQHKPIIDLYFVVIQLIIFLLNWSVLISKYLNAEWLGVVHKSKISLDFGFEDLSNTRVSTYIQSFISWVPRTCLKYNTTPQKKIKIMFNYRFIYIYIV